MPKSLFSFVPLVFVLSLATATFGTADETDGCHSAFLTEPDRVIYQCDNGLVIEAETMAELEAMVPGLTIPPETVSIENRAVLIDLEKGAGPFQIRTPHAIASVRGTVFVVDATPDQTSVFVVEGIVDVRGLNGTESAELSAGEGVVVTSDPKLVVKRWPQEKVTALLARFAR